MSVSDEAKREVQATLEGIEQESRQVHGSIRRINVNFSKSAYETLEQLAIVKGKTMSEVLRDAIQLEKWLTDAQDDGWHILLEKDGRVRELVRI